MSRWRMRLVGCVVVLVVGMVGLVGVGVVSADENTVDIGTCCYIMEQSPDWCSGGGTWLTVDNYIDNQTRMVLRLPKQGGTDTIDEVLLKVRWADYTEGHGSGCYLRAYRVTRRPEFYDVTWNEYKDGGSWTSKGGDYTTLNYGESAVPGSYSWVTFDVTEMALDRWELDEDLYVIVRFKFEDKSSGERSMLHFVGPSHGSESYRPRMVVRYTGAVPSPAVDGSVVEYDDVSAEVKIAPTLAGESSADVWVEWDVYGSGNWSYNTTPENVTGDGLVYHDLTGLSSETQYEVRTVLEYGGEDTKVYSDEFDLTTLAYTPVAIGTPTNEGCGLYEMDVKVTYDTKDVGSGWFWLEYRVVDGAWEATSAVSVNGSGSETWEVEGIGYIHARGVFENAYGEVKGEEAKLDFGEDADVDWTVEEQGNDYVVIGAEYLLNGASNITIWAEVREGESGDYDYISDELVKTSSGSQNFTFSNLVPYEYYEWRGAYCAEGVTTYEAWTGFYPSEVEVHPTVSTLGVWLLPPIEMRLRAGVTLNDVNWDVGLAFQARKKDSGVLVGVTPGITVSEDGTYEEEYFAGAGSIFKFGETYEVRAILEYEIGTVYGEWEEQRLPDEPAPGTYLLEPDQITKRSVRVRAKVWTGDYGDVVVWFEWGEVPNPADEVLVTEPGQLVTLVIRDLSPGTTYDYRLVAAVPVGSGWGEFTTVGEDEGTGLFPGYPEWPSIPGLDGFDWAIAKLVVAIVVIVATGGVLAWKLRHRQGMVVTMVGMLGVLVFFIAIGFIARWIAVLVGMAMVLGLVYAIKSGTAGSET